MPDKRFPRLEVRYAGEAEPPRAAWMGWKRLSVRMAQLRCSPKSALKGRSQHDERSAC